jgi:carbonic anhydrase/acetyltransferase-like protein (isoleucine patch superfamily)
MATIIEVRGKTPELGENCYVAPNATIVGDVICGDNCSFWFGAVVRGDVNSIRLGNYVNVQDNAVLHCTFEKTKLIVGNNVSIAHSAVVHGCTIGNNVLIGIGAIVLDNSVIEDNVIVAAGSVVWLVVLSGKELNLV